MGKVNQSHMICKLSEDDAWKFLLAAEASSVLASKLMLANKFVVAMVMLK